MYGSCLAKHDEEHRAADLELASDPSNRRVTSLAHRMRSSSGRICRHVCNVVIIMSEHYESNCGLALAGEIEMRVPGS
jgi:hypothetical protein